MRWLCPSGVNNTGALQGVSTCTQAPAVTKYPTGFYSYECLASILIIMLLYDRASSESAAKLCLSQWLGGRISCHTDEVLCSVYNDNSGLSASVCNCDCQTQYKT